MRSVVFTGDRYGSLVVLAGRKKVKGRLHAECMCDCGVVKYIAASSLVRGLSRSCGCGQRWNVKHGMYGTPVYHVWSAMVQRCTNARNPYYHNYGGRGITVCDEWLSSAESFIAWAIESGYAKGLTLDRIDNNSGYRPDNCRWISLQAQQRNKRTNRNVTYNGATKCVTDWAEGLGISCAALRYRLRRYGVCARVFTPKGGES